MQLLPAGWRDFWAIWLLQNVTFGRDAWDPIELGWQLLTAPVRLKALEDGLVQGYVFGERRDREGVGWITTLGVHPRHRQRGLGRQLLQAAEAALATPTVRLTVRPSNVIALRLYEQSGYRPTRRIPRYYVGGEDGLEMEKPALGSD